MRRRKCSPFTGSLVSAARKWLPPVGTRGMRSPCRPLSTRDILGNETHASLGASWSDMVRAVHRRTWLMPVLFPLHAVPCWLPACSGRPLVPEPWGSSGVISLSPKGAMLDGSPTRPHSDGMIQLGGWGCEFWLQKGPTPHGLAV